MRHVTKEGLNLIKRFEGFSPTIYIGSVREICGVAHVVSLAQRILGVMAHVR